MAALQVVVFHIIAGFGPSVLYTEGRQWEAFPAWFQWLVRHVGKHLWDGGMAVATFFVLSGFVLSLGFFQKGSVRSL